MSDLLATKLITKICALCLQPFIVTGHKRQLKRKFCSGLCAKISNGERNKGRKHTEEWKQNLRERNSGTNNPFYGRSHTEETKKKLSLKTQKSKSTTSTTILGEKELSIDPELLLVVKIMLIIFYSG